MKHAQMSTTWLIWLLRIVFLSVIIFSLSTMILRYANARIDVSHIHANILTYRLLLDKSLFNTDPVTSRLTPLFLQKTIPEQIDDKFVYPEGVVTARMHVQDKKVYYRKQDYARRALLQPSLFGKEFFHTTTEYPIFFNDKPTTLSVDVYVRT